MASPYFRRLWVVREFAIAKNIFMWFDNVAIPPALIYGCMKYLNQYSIQKSLYLTTETSGDAIRITSAVGYCGLARLIEQRDLAKNSAMTKRNLPPY